MRTHLLAFLSIATLAGGVPVALAQESSVLAGPTQVSQATDAEHAEDYAELLTQLPNTTHSLASGIEQVAVGTEVPTEAKFEMEEGVLKLSVYTSEKGLETIPEENVFKEYKGDATQAQWAPEEEVFEDFVHIARSAQYHTLLSMTDVTIPQIIEKASAGGNTVFSVKAKVRDGRPVFEVLTAADGQAEETLYDLMTGEPISG